MSRRMISEEKQRALDNVTYNTIEGIKLKAATTVGGTLYINGDTYQGETAKIHIGAGVLTYQNNRWGAIVSSPGIKVTSGVTAETGTKAGTGVATAPEGWLESDTQQISDVTYSAGDCFVVNAGGLVIAEVKVSDKYYTTYVMEGTDAIVSATPVDPLPAGVESYSIQTFKKFVLE